MMTIKEATGYSKEKAFETLGLDIDLKKLVNATQMWKKAGSPMSDKALKAFLTDYMAKRKETGAYIVVDAASDDTRLRPYTVLKETTVGKAKYTTKYQIKEAEFTFKTFTEKEYKVDAEGNETLVDVKTPYKKETVTYEVLDKESGEKVSKTKEIEVPEVKLTHVGQTVAEASKQDEADKIMKELIKTEKRGYVVEKTKVVTEGNQYTSYGAYTPSSSAKAGKFVFFVEA